MITDYVSSKKAFCVIRPQQNAHQTYIRIINHTLNLQ